MSAEASIQDIKAILAAARQRAYAAINFAMVEAYWLIGRRIVQEEQEGASRAGYGEGLIKQLSKALTAELERGFSVANLENFRKFYLTFPEAEKGYAAGSFLQQESAEAPMQQKSYALRRELTWTHYRLIMRVQNEDARRYYMNEAADQQWSSRTLERHINTFYYQRLLSTQKGESAPALAPGERQSPQDFIKDPYVFEFLNLPQPAQATERALETALIEDLQRFLLELGKGFSFVGRQYRISTETKHFYIDLVFYNYILKCFVLFDLKTAALEHADIGQMDMYIRLFDALKRGEGDGPTIGIILCTDKDATVVKYSILEGHEQLFASKYMPWLPTEEELIAEVERERLAIELRKSDSENLKGIGYEF